MPKIFGIVSYSIAENKLYCRKCGYWWKPTEENKKYIKVRRMISCPVCRALKSRGLTDPLDTKNSIYAIQSKLLSRSYSDLTRGELSNIDIPVSCNICNHNFYIKSRDIGSDIQCPNCKNNNQQTKPAVKPTVKLETAIKSEPAVKPELKSPLLKDRLANKQNSIITENKKSVTKTGSASKLNKTLNSETKEPLDSEETLKLKIKAFFDKHKNERFNHRMILRAIDSEGQLVQQCIKCGQESTISSGIITSKIARRDIFVCDRCREFTKSKIKPLDALRLRYLNKVFNGLIITSIYYNENEEIACDAICCRCETNSKLKINSTKNIEPRKTGIPLGDIINYRYCCPTCGREKICINGGLTPEMQRIFNCKKFSLQGWNNFGNSGYNSNRGGVKGDLSLKDILTTNGKLCEYCRKRETCQDKDSLSLNFANIRDELDRNTQKSKIYSDVKARCPAITSGSTVSRDSNNEHLMVFRDAYVGTDKKIYKFCKCIDHGTEIILNETEISNFDHSQCTKPGLMTKFFNLREEYLLKTKTTGK